MFVVKEAIQRRKEIKQKGRQSTAPKEEYDEDECGDGGGGKSDLVVSVVTVVSWFWWFRDGGDSVLRVWW